MLLTSLSGIFYHPTLTGQSKIRHGSNFKIFFLRNEIRLVMFYLSVHLTALVPSDGGKKEDVLLFIVDCNRYGWY